MAFAYFCTTTKSKNTKVIVLALKEPGRCKQAKQSKGKLTILELRPSLPIRLHTGRMAEEHQHHVN